MMEPLSDLLRKIPDPAHIRKAEEKVRQIMADPLVRKWRAKNPELDDHTLRVHMNRLYQYVTEYNNCMQCPGLERCPNDMAGHYTRLSVETSQNRTYICDYKVSCKKFLAQQAHDAVKNRIRSFYIDEQALKHGYSLDEILDKDLERVKAVDRLVDYILKTKEEGLQKDGLYLVGKFGTGKTFLMCYLLHELAKIGLTGVIVYMPDFVEDLKAMLSEPQKLKETIDLFKETDLLIFDDIGAENLNPWVRDHVLGSILNYRMNRKPTFYTSNYELDALQKHFSFTNKDGDEEYKGERLMDRIRPFVEVIVVKGDNQRGKSSAAV